MSKRRYQIHTSGVWMERAGSEYVLVVEPGAWKVETSAYAGWYRKYELTPGTYAVQGCCVAWGRRRKVSVVPVESDQMTYATAKVRGRLVDGDLRSRLGGVASGSDEAIEREKALGEQEVEFVIEPWDVRKAIEIVGKVGV